MKGCFAPGGFCGCCCELCQPVRCVIDQHEVEIIPATYRSSSSVTSSERTYRSIQEMASHRSQSGDPPTSRSTAVSSNVEHFSGSSRRRAGGGRHTSSRLRSSQREGGSVGPFNGTSISSPSRGLKSLSSSKNRPFFFEHTTKHGLSPPPSSCELYSGYSGSEGFDEARPKWMVSSRSDATWRSTRGTDLCRKNSADHVCGGGRTQDLSPSTDLRLRDVAPEAIMCIEKGTPLALAQNKSASVKERDESFFVQGTLSGSYSSGTSETTSVDSIAASIVSCRSRSPWQDLVAGVRRSARVSSSRLNHGSLSEADTCLSPSPLRSLHSRCSNSPVNSASPRIPVPRADSSISSDAVGNVPCEDVSLKRSFSQTRLRLTSFSDEVTAASCSTRACNLTTGSASVAQPGSVLEEKIEGHEGELVRDLRGHKSDLGASCAYRRTRAGNSKTNRLARVERQQHALQMTEDQQRVLHLLANQQRLDPDKARLLAEVPDEEHGQNRARRLVRASGLGEHRLEMGALADAAGLGESLGRRYHIPHAAFAGWPDDCRRQSVISSSSGSSLPPSEGPFYSRARRSQAMNLVQGDCYSCSGEVDSLSFSEPAVLCSCSSTSHACRAWYPSEARNADRRRCALGPSALAPPPVRQLPSCPAVELATRSRHSPWYSERSRGEDFSPRVRSKRERTIWRNSVPEWGGNQPRRSDPEGSPSRGRGEDSDLGGTVGQENGLGLEERLERSLALSRRLRAQAKKVLSERGKKVESRSGLWNCERESRGAAVGRGPSRVAQGTDLSVAAGSLNGTPQSLVSDSGTTTASQATVCVSRGARLVFWHRKVTAVRASDSHCPPSAPSLVLAEGSPLGHE
ncbi:hypothetical protein CSUI_001913 [Cystoisospora suis]|uniref:Uncharacterized protein n=1 Tax=Cystoisospora suis TaxID=483139 RepID=A0A2C6KJK2_9APIC|nr:hypothetical protein CSUI_001913 [Cystoisospora suis]